MSKYTDIVFKKICTTKKRPEKKRNIHSYDASLTGSNKSGTAKHYFKKLVEKPCIHNS